MTIDVGIVCTTALLLTALIGWSEPEKKHGMISMSKSVSFVLAHAQKIVASNGEFCGPQPQQLPHSSSVSWIDGCSVFLSLVKQLLKLGLYVLIERKYENLQSTGLTTKRERSLPTAFSDCLAMAANIANRLHKWWSDLGSLETLLWSASNGISFWFAHCQCVFNERIVRVIQKRVTPWACLKYWHRFIEGPV